MLESISPTLTGFLLLGSILAGVGMALFLAAVRVMAVVLLRPPRMNDGKAVWALKRLSPADLGLAFSVVDFEVRDDGARLRIAAWWIPHARAQGRCVVLVHGYADAKVGAIAWAPTLHALGCNILAVDLRAHGESGGRYSTGGFRERHDLSQVIDQLRASRPRETARIILMGVSLGAAVAAGTAALREDIAAVILESPFSDYRHAVMAHGDALGMPGWMFQRAALAQAQRISGADFAAVRPVELIQHIRCPVMIIHSGEDLFVGAEDLEALKNALAARPGEYGAGVLWCVEGAEHAQALRRRDPVEYRRRIAEFLGIAQS